MDCAHCGTSTIAFRVPAALASHVPDGEAATICPRCLHLEPATEDDAAAPDFSKIIDGFPDGEAGAAMALGVGLAVDSLALNRDAIADCLAAVGDRGADPWLVLERLAASGSVQPDADLERIRRQLEQLLR